MENCIRFFVNSSRPACLSFDKTRQEVRRGRLATTIICRDNTIEDMRYSASPLKKVCRSLHVQANEGGTRQAQYWRGGPAQHSQLASLSREDT